MVFLRSEPGWRRSTRSRAAPGSRRRCCIGLWPREVGDEGRAPPAAASIVDRRRRTYGQPTELFEHVARRCSLVLGVNITPAQAILCLVDLKVARLLTIQGTSTASSTSEATPAAWRSFCPMRELRSHLGRHGARRSMPRSRSASAGASARTKMPAPYNACRATRQLHDVGKTSGMGLRNRRGAKIPDQPHHGAPQDRNGASKRSGK